MLRSIASALIWAIAVTMILGELGVNLGPLIAGAGIAGVAIGFGAQSLVKDFLSGIFMLVEDQYGVGDIIDAGEATRHGRGGDACARPACATSSGTVWHIPNGTIVRVGNMSQQWARALLDVDVAYGTDVDEAQAVIKRVADSVGTDPEWRGRILEEPEVWGIESLGPDAIVDPARGQDPAGRAVPGDARAAPPAVRRVHPRGHRDPRSRSASVWVRRDQGSSHEVEGRRGADWPRPTIRRPAVADAAER